MTSQQLSKIQKSIEHLLQLMNVQAQVTTEVGESQVVTIQIDGDDLGILIGYHGETLSSLQTIAGLLVNRQVEASADVARYKVVVNVGDYRERQRESLEALARRTAERVRFTKKQITLPSMSSFDRRIVHLALEHEQDIMSESEGEGRDRRLVVRLKES